MYIIWFECSRCLFLSHLENSWWNGIWGVFTSFGLGFKLICSCKELTGTDNISQEKRNCTLLLFSVSLGREHSPHWKVATLPGHILELFWIKTSSGRSVWTLSCICFHIINFIHSNIAVSTYCSLRTSVPGNFSWSLCQGYCFVDYYVGTIATINKGWKSH